MESQVLENQIEEEIQPDSESSEPVNTSVRDELQKAFAKAKEEPTERLEKPKAAVTKPRAEDGKFVKDVKPKVESKTEKVDSAKNASTEHKSFAATPTAGLETAPRSYTNAVKAKWAELPEDVRQELIKREKDVETGFTKVDEERHLGRQMKDIINPYMPVIQSMGYSAPNVVQSLLNSAYILKTGTPEQKLQHLQQIAESYGINPAELTKQNSQPSIDPTVAALMREMAQLKGERQQELTTKQQQEKEVVNQTIREFAADTEAHPHFEAVRQRMAALLNANQAQNLQDAYEQAIYADPNIRSTLIESHYADNEAKQIADKKAKAEQARKAGSSIKGGPGVAVSNGKPQTRSLREELRINLRAATGTI